MREREGRIGRRWQSREMFEGRTVQMGAGAEIRSQNEDSTGAELSARWHEMQVEIKVDAEQ